MAQKMIDMAGKRVKRLRVICRAGRFPRGAIRWRCRCRCGALCFYTAGDLRSGRVLSCGCARRERMRARGDGRARTAEYGVWHAMKRRCSYLKGHAYADYGGRGIRVCARWRRFENFLRDMGRRPGSDWVIDRIDPNWHYTPGNCRWLPRRLSADNTRRNILLTFRRRTQPVGVWARQLRLSYWTLRGRLLRGWTARDALTVPVGGRTARQRDRARRRLHGHAQAVHRRPHLRLP